MAPSGTRRQGAPSKPRSEEHTSELQSQSNLVCRLLLEKTNDASGRLRGVRYRAMQNCELLIVLAGSIQARPAAFAECVTFRRDIKEDFTPESQKILQKR